MEQFAGAMTLNEKYDIDQAQLLGRGKLSVVHRTRRHAFLPSTRRRARMHEQSLQAPHPVPARPPAVSRRADGQLVVLKKIQVFEMGKNERSECMNEIELLRQMQHPHIISYLDCVLEVRRAPSLCSHAPALLLSLTRPFAAHGVSQWGKHHRELTPPSPPRRTMS